MSAPFCDAAVRQAARARLARGRAVVERRRSLLSYMQAMSETGNYVAGWAHVLICDYLQRFSDETAAGLGPRYILQVPPQHGKTEHSAIGMPTFHMGRHPHSHVIVATYGDKLSIKSSRKAMRYAEKSRDLCQWSGMAQGEVWNVSEWATSNGSTYRPVSIKGAGGGFESTMLVVDDYTKNAADASSAAHNEANWEWFTQVGSARVMAGGGILILSTRWGEDDLIGRLLRVAEEDPEAEQWTVLSLPALSEDGMDRHPVDLANREVDEALAPYMHSTEKLRRQRRTMKATPRGAHRWSAVYQQAPAASDGTFFLREWFGRRYDDHPRLMAAQCSSIWMTIDSAESDSADSAHTSIQLWGLRGVERYLLHRRSVQLRPFELIEVVREELKSWHPNAVLIENKSSGITLISFLRKEHPNVIAFNPGSFGSKEDRADHSAGVLAAGNVYLPAPRYLPGVIDFIEQHVSFPAKDLKDDVDAFSQLCIQVDEVYRQRPGADTPSGADRLALWEQVMSAA